MNNKIKRFPMLLISLALLMTGCSNGIKNNNSNNSYSAGGIDSAPAIQSSEPNKNSGAVKTIPQELEEIPDEYFSSAEKQGKLEELSYDTYESFRYEDRSQVLTKRAIIYLPYGYTEDEQYDIFYLMHGGWSNETSTLGTPDSPNDFKNVIDNLIADERIKPVIIVCPTYNNTSGDDSGDFSLAMSLNRNYHNELINDLIPAVESKYSTFAESTAKEDLISSRDHRAFGGFSMGSVATWRVFQYGLDYFSKFLPMSCGTTLDDKEIWKAAENYEQGDYFVWSITGTSDFAYSYVESRVEKMRSSDYFTEGENFAYSVKDGYSHDGKAAMEYTYNGLLYFFGETHSENNPKDISPTDDFTTGTKVSEVLSATAFEDFGRQLFPIDRSVSDDMTLDDISDSSIYTWYSYIDPDKTVEILNRLKNDAENGGQIFYRIYSDEEIAEDASLADTGLFFFKGKPGEKFAIMNAGGGFVYVGAMHDSFPHALEVSEKGYNAFALIYRPDYAYDDLARAISFIIKNADVLEVDPNGFSLWGGSAGARMAATLGNADYASQYGVPQASAVIMQYTGYTYASKNDAPTYACVGTNDGIANWQTMQHRLQELDSYGIPTEFHSYDGLPHGFGLGTNTVADGWIDDAINFWESNM
ncbi:MAG: alpha/beta hydrolase-fold protein [Porcipelethomonas sp.]